MIKFFLSYAWSEGVTHKEEIASDLALLKESGLI